MMTTKLKHIEGIEISIKHNKPLDAGIIAELQALNTKIYCNDTTGELWAFDRKLKPGLWLENMIFNNELTKMNCLILN